MSQQLSFSDLVKGATRLDSKDYEKFVTTVNKLRAEQQPDTLSPQEAALLKKINYGFPIEKWQRLQDLDVKMEETSLSEQEYTELTSLTDTYEKYCVQRIGGGRGGAGGKRGGKGGGGGGGPTQTVA